MDSRAEQLKRSVEQIAKVLRGLELELLAFHLTLLAFKKLHPAEGSLFEVSLELAKQSQGIQQMMDQKYSKAVEQLHEQVEREQIEVAVATWIQSWKPTDPTGLKN